MTIPVIRSRQRSAALTASALVGLTALLALSGCGDHAHPPTANPVSATTAARPGLAVPASARAQLGITFAPAQWRQVTATLRVAAQFAPRDGGTVLHHAPAAGRLERLVAPLATVEAGQPLFAIAAPAWTALLNQLDDTQLAVERAPRVAADAAALAEALTRAETVAQARVAALATLDGHQAERAAALEQLAGLSERAALARREASRAQYDHDVLASVRFTRVLREAAAMSAIPAPALSSTTSGAPAWRTHERLVVRALCRGQLDALLPNDGAMVEVGQTLTAVSDPARLLATARLAQGDLPRVGEGTRARIVPADASETWSIDATVHLHPQADASNRTLGLSAIPSAPLPAHARAGSACMVEIVLAGGEEYLAIPRSAVIRDGVRTLFFKRLAQDPDRVIAVELDAGPDDGRFIAVQSDLKEGEEVVISGVYALLLATQATQSGGAAKAGHFHADGTFHEGAH